MIKTDFIVKNSRNALMTQKRKLVSNELHKCQKQQPGKMLISSDDVVLMKYHQIQFHHVHHLMSERDHLTFNLFLVASICSDEDRFILRDMIVLCQQNVEVFFRSSLESKKSTCLMTDHKLKLDRCVILYLSSFSVYTSSD